MRTPSPDPTKRRPPQRLRELVKPWEPSYSAIRVQGAVWAQQGSLRIQATMASLIIVSSPVLLPRALLKLYRGSVAEVLGRGAENNLLYTGRAARAQATS